MNSCLRFVWIRPVSQASPEAGTADAVGAAGDVQDVPVLHQFAALGLQPLPGVLTRQPQSDASESAGAVAVPGHWVYSYLQQLSTLVGGNPLEGRKDDKRWTVCLLPEDCARPRRRAGR